MLLRDPLERSSPAQLLQEPALQQSYEALPDVMLEEPAETNLAPKPKTAYQLFQDTHREEARVELQTSGLSLCLSCCLLPVASLTKLTRSHPWQLVTCFFSIFCYSLDYFLLCQVQQQGFQGGKVAQELFRRWKVLLSEGGDELQLLRAREAELRGQTDTLVATKKVAVAAGGPLGRSQHEKDGKEGWLLNFGTHKTNSIMLTEHIIIDFVLNIMQAQGSTRNDRKLYGTFA